MSVRKQLRSYLHTHGEEESRTPLSVTYFVLSDTDVEVIEKAACFPKEVRVSKVQTGLPSGKLAYTVTVKGAWLVGWDA